MTDSIFDFEEMDTVFSNWLGDLRRHLKEILDISWFDVYDWDWFDAFERGLTVEEAADEYMYY